jgi:hypothetical protein
MTVKVKCKACKDLGYIVKKGKTTKGVICTKCSKACKFCDNTMKIDSGLCKGCNRCQSCGTNLALLSKQIHNHENNDYYDDYTG